MIELIGGTGIARTLVLEAIGAGKHVVTANKALLARARHRDLRGGARERRVVAFEAAVAGGIPIIKALREGLTANRIEWIAGIINGTTNFILSEMREKRIDFATALAEAQRLGYAEADPTFDIERRRRRPQGDDRERDRVRRSGAVRRRPTSKASSSCRPPTSPTPSSSATGSSCSHHEAARQRDQPGHRAARASDAGSVAAPDRQRRRRDERGDGAGRRRRHDALLRQGRGRRADRVGGDRRPGRHDAPAHRRSGPSRAASRVPARRRSQDLAVLPIDDVVTAFYLRLRSPTRPACWRDITRHPRRARHLDRRAAAATGAAGVGEARPT